MRDVKWTPGPWRIAPPEYGWDHFAAILDKDGIVARCHIAALSRSHEQTAADAHLIAAAPELYEVLATHPGYSADTTFAEIWLWLARKDAALAKARGETPDA